MHTMHTNKKYKPSRAVLNVKAGVGGLIAGLIAILSIAATITSGQSESCGGNGRTCCSPVWGPPICATAYVYGCWYSGSEYLHREYHSVSAVKTVDASYAFRGFWCSASFCYPEYDYPGHASGTFSVSRTEYKLVHLAETYIIAAFYGTELDLPDVCGAFVSITAGGGV